MQIQIHADDLDLTEGLRDHVAKRLAHALKHGREVVSRIVVRLSDVNGPRGGVDKCCGIEIRIKGASAIAIDDTQADLYVAIDRAAERAGRALDRRIARRHQFAMRHSNRYDSTAFAAVGWLWGHGKTLAEGTPDAVRFVTSQVEQAVPGARQILGEWLPAVRPEPPPRDVSGTDIGPVTPFFGLTRSHWNRNGSEITVRYEGRADFAAVLDHYAKGFAAQGYAQSVMSATPEAEVHEYGKGDDRVHFETTHLPQGRVRVTIVAALP
ncbi:MAG TPA: HPF/RaiA family ribosome-associated protein [Accumulibacter sp.]|uniref:HPF/RaiA family ribosome-associated protein n=1 Tax=Accumulibacter sp. TaxID=2053492 RepID=UPI0025EA773C|nr:HPF/RaiA family ribosome-associated protein [Accumulibacter sp.]MCM8597904.1 HPF/RaiA family ribosome-associated protein [Accumulibacter sp.]MCM8661770.1 HPF/RaiA family ribosome-associated protein [Accumulibacter sp.]HNC51143.1 HPF/RaiA family ribosome-associated protein [Accumulibacter sp.]